ncbi:ABC transporter ATP-binding protein [Oceanospirillum sp.]|uniref:ABC transporter ATP-binding protein n=1 Tax=Oceanospirillum sp. TaxID=2021254 RepID=UPI003A8FF7F7
MEVLTGKVIIDLKQLSFAWPDQAKPALSIDAFRLNAGERLFVYGPSGCGKSTLLSLLAGVVVPQKGQITIAGQRIEALSAAKRDHFRADHIGLVFQQFNLLPYLNVLDNVTLACDFSHQRVANLKQAKVSALDEAKRLLSRLLLPEPLWTTSVMNLSIGQQQRVAVARALIGAPDLIIADEPTSALDRESRDQFLQLLMAETEQSGSSLVFVSHDDSLKSHFDRHLHLPTLNQAVSTVEPSEVEGTNK